MFSFPCTSHLNFLLNLIYVEMWTVNSCYVNYKVRVATQSCCVQTGGVSSLVVIMKQSCAQHQYLNISWMSELLLMCLQFSLLCCLFTSV